MADLFAEASALHAARKDLLAKVGEAYLHLGEIEASRRQVESQISEYRFKISAVEGALAAANEEIIKDRGLPDGRYEIDYDNQRVVSKDGQVPDSGNSQPQPND